MRLMFILVFSSLFLACTKESNTVKHTSWKDTICQCVDDSNCKWSRPFQEDTGWVGDCKPYLCSSGDVVFGTWGNGPKEVFKCFNGINGSQIWNWSDYIKDVELFNQQSILQISNQLILCSRNATYSFNIQSGTTLWKHIMDSMVGDPFIYDGHDGYVYHSFTGNKNPKKVYVYRTSVESAHWENIMTFEDSSAEANNWYMPSLTFSINKDGEQCLIYTACTFQSEKVKSIIGCYNLSKNKTVWVHDYSDDCSFYHVAKLTIINGIICTSYTYNGMHYIRAFDTVTGNEKWTYQLPDFPVCLYPFNDALIVVTSNKSPVISLQVSSGSINWISEVSYTNSMFIFGFDNSIVFKHYLIATQDKFLYVVNLENGLVVLNKMILPYQFNMAYSGVAINESRRLLYVADKQYACCVRLPEEIKY